MTRCVLFDLDGTLIDTLNLYIKTVHQTIHTIGRSKPSLDEIASLRLNSEPRLMAYFHPPDKVEDAHRRFLDNYRQLHSRYFGGVYPGVDGLLTSLRSRGIKTGIVSGKSRGAWEITRQHVHLGDFDTTILDDDVSSPKPDAEGILMAMANLGASSTETVYVGDSPDDLKAAKTAGIGFHAAMWSKSKSETQAFERAASEIGPYAGLSKPAEVERFL